MDDKTKLAIVLILAVVLGIPILGTLAGKEKPAESPAPAAPKAQPAMRPQAMMPPQAAPMPPPAPAQQFQPRPMAPPPAPKPAPPPPMNLANTAWTLSTPDTGNVTVQLFSNGTALAQSDKFPMQVTGTWVQNGNSLTVSAMGRSISAQLQGDQLVAMGYAAKRLR